MDRTDVEAESNMSFDRDRRWTLLAQLTEAQGAFTFEAPKTSNRRWCDKAQKESRPFERLATTGADIRLPWARWFCRLLKPLSV